MQERMKHLGKDLHLMQVQEALPFLWPHFALEQLKFTDLGFHWYTCRVIRLHSKSTNKDDGIKMSKTSAPG